MARIGAVVADMELRSASFNRDMKAVANTVTAETRKIRRSMREVQRSFKTVQRETRALRNGFAALAGALAVRQFTNFTQQAIKTADQFAKLSKTVGLSTEQLQSYRLAAQLSGVDLKVFNSSLSAFAKRMGEARGNTGPLVTGLKTLDKELLRNLQNAKDQNDALKILADAMSEASDAADRARLSNAAFSRAGLQMNAFLIQGADSLDQFVQNARDLGIIFSDTLIQQAERAGDAILTLNTVFDAAFSKSILTTFVASVGDTSEALSSAAEAGRAFGTLVGVAMRGVSEAAIVVAENLDLITAAVAALVAMKAAALFAGIASAVIVFATTLTKAAKAQAILNVLLSKSAIGLLLKLSAAALAAGAAYTAMNADLAEAAARIEENLGLFDGLATGLTGFGGIADETTQTLEEQEQAVAKLREQLQFELDQLERTSLGQEIYNTLARAGIDVDTEHARALVPLITELFNKREALEAAAEAERAAEQATAERARQAEQAAREAARQAEQLRREALRPFERAADGIQDTFSDLFRNILDGGETSFKDLASSIVDTFKDLLAELFTLAIARPIVVPIVQQLTGPLGLGSAPGTGGGSLLNILGGGGLPGGGGGGGLFGGLFGGGSTSSNVLNDPFGFGPGVISLDASSVSTSLGVQAPASSGFFGNLFQGGLLSPGGFEFSAGSLIGPALGLFQGLAGGQGIGQTLVSSGLGLAGSALGGPVGGIIGGLAGGLLGGLFGDAFPGPPQSFATGSLGSVRGFADNAGNASVAVQALNEALQQASAVAEGAGVEFRQTADAFLQIDEESGRATARIGEAMGQFSSATEAQAFLVAELTSGIRDQVIAQSNLSEAYKAALEPLTDLQQVTEAIAALGEAQALPRTVEEVAELRRELTPLEREIAQVNDASAALTERLEALGVAQVAAADIEANRIAEINFVIRRTTDDLVSGVIDRFEDLSDYNNSQLRRDIEGLELQFVELSDSAREAGLASAELVRIQEAQAEAFSRIFSNITFGVEQQIVGVTNNLQSQIDAINRDANQVADQIRAAGRAAGIDEDEIERQVERVRVLKRARLEEAVAAARASDQLLNTTEELTNFGNSLRQFIDGILTGANSSLTPRQRLTEAQRIFGDTLAVARTGDLTAVNRVQSDASVLLEAARAAHSTAGVAFGGIESFVISSLQSLGSTLGAPGFQFGTLNAARGAARVGEAGEEIVMFGGGERVIPNHQLGLERFGHGQDRLVAEFRGLRREMAEDRNDRRFMMNQMERLAAAAGVRR